MKKKMLIGVLSASLILGGALAVGATNNDDKKTAAPKISETKKMISTQEAKEIALSKVNGYVEEIELESDHDRHYYEVEVESNNHDDVDIYIDAYSGEVLAMEDDHDDDVDRVKESQASKQNVITEQEAVNIAEKATNGIVKEIELDEDDNRLIYEVELKTKNGEADVDIDAVTGNVLQLEYDDLD